MRKNIVLIGMPGSGKTTIGLLISRKLKKKFVDMDNYITTKQNMSIPDMFAISEDYFRNAETECAKELGKKKSNVIATGGGIVKRKENIDYLRRNSVIVFVNRHPEDIVTDVDINSRPLLKDGIDNIYKLYNERINLYKEYCNIEIINDTTIGDTVDKIITAVEDLKKTSNLIKD